MSDQGEAEFLASLDRIRRGDDLYELRPTFDAKIAREHALAAMGGRKPESYRQALEHYGFKFVPRARLKFQQARTLQPSDEGMWFHLKLKFAFAESHLCGEFQGPEDFDTFMRKQIAMRVLARTR